LHACAPQDPLCGAHVAAELHRRFDRYPARRITECPDLGYFPHLEDPQRVALALQRFLLVRKAASWRGQRPARAARKGQLSTLAAARETVCYLHFIL
jgi:hypothetical protein